MRTIETTGHVAADGTLTVRVPPDIVPGDHAVVVIIDDRGQVNGAGEAQPAGDEATTTRDEQIEALLAEEPDPERRARLEAFIKSWPVHDSGPWPENLSLRREDLYDDWGR